MKIIQKFLFNLLKIQKLKPYQSILILVSGGQDSITLLFLFIKVKNYFKWRVGVVFCDHLIEEKNFLINNFINQLCYNWKIEFYTIVTTTLINNENDARKWRYKKALKLANYYNYRCIATGHTETDNLESFFLNLFRGSSFINLQLIKEYYNIKDNKILIRPLLKFSRTDIYLFSKVYVLPLYKDETNKRKDFLRNRLRNQLFPYLKIYFNLNLERKFYQNFLSFESEKKYLKFKNKVILQHLLFCRKDIVFCYYIKYCNISINTQRLILHQILKYLKVYSINYLLIENIRQKILKNFSNSINLQQIPVSIEIIKFKQNKYILFKKIKK